MKQYLLPISLSPNATFGNYSAKTPLARNMLEQLAQPKGAMILHGPTGSGKTHLLHAACRATETNWLYLNCAQLDQTQPSILEDLQSELICIDNIEKLAKKPAWEDAIFVLLLNHPPLIISSTLLPVPFMREDVRSRLSQMTSYKLHEMSEEEQFHALEQRSINKGFPVSHELIQWMQTHLPRNNHCLFDFIDQLETESLRNKKKPSIHLARGIWESRQANEPI